MVKWWENAGKDTCCIADTVLLSLNQSSIEDILVWLVIFDTLRRIRAEVALKTLLVMTSFCERIFTLGTYWRYVVSTVGVKYICL